MKFKDVMDHLEKAAEVFANFDHPEDKETADALERVIAFLKVLEEEANR